MYSELFPWQGTTWNEIRQWGERFPHAVLFHGPPGIGKLALARFVARSLLCQNPRSDQSACGACTACIWVAAGNHPDYRLVRPEALALAEGLADAESADTEGESPEGELDQDTPKARRAPSKEVRIQQIRELGTLLNVGSHGGGRRVVLIYPAHAMNVFTANALLKILEEPPAGTVFLLVTESMERLLPTVVSRCRTLALTCPASEIALGWLREQGVPRAGELLAEQGGAPLAALRAADDFESNRPLRDGLFAVLARPDGLASLAVAERLAKSDPALVVGWIQRWLYDCIAYCLARRIRYYPSEQSAIAALSANLDIGRCLAYAKTLSSERRVADHPLNARLFVENLLLGYCRALQVR